MNVLLPEIEQEEVIMCTEKINMYIIRSLSMTNWLCSNGPKILKVEDSEKDPNLKVFFFEDTVAVVDLINYQNTDLLACL